MTATRFLKVVNIAGPEKEPLYVQALGEEIMREMTPEQFSALCRSIQYALDVAKAGSELHRAAVDVLPILEARKPWYVRLWQRMWRMEEVVVNEGV